MENRSRQVQGMGNPDFRIRRDRRIILRECLGVGPTVVVHGPAMRGVRLCIDAQCTKLRRTRLVSRSPTSRNGGNHMQLFRLVRAAAVAVVVAAGAVFVPVTAVTAQETTIRLPSWWFGEPGNEVWMNKSSKPSWRNIPTSRWKDTTLSYGAYADQMMLEISSGAPPDVIHLTNLNIGDYLRNDLLLPLERVHGAIGHQRRGRSLRPVCVTDRFGCRPTASSTWLPTTFPSTTRNCCGGRVRGVPGQPG